MAKPRVFISSTFYDLKQVRADIDIFLDQLGYEAVRNEEGDIPYGKEEALEEYCYKEISTIDILVSIIGSRFGSESISGDSSISQMELKVALNENKQVYVFIESNVLSEYETYLLNKNTDVKFRYVDDPRIYPFIEEIKLLSSNNNIKGFDHVSDITKYLKEQLAGLFQRFLQEQTRVKEVNLIRGLEKTAQTLNRLVSFLSDENKDQAEEINRILSINHPLVEQIRAILGINYNFYFETLPDVVELLKSQYFTFDTNYLPFDSVYEFTKDTGSAVVKLEINSSIFDSDEKLKFYRKSDWEEGWVKYIEVYKISDDDDDLPF